MQIAHNRRQVRTMYESHTYHRVCQLQQEKNCILGITIAGSNFQPNNHTRISKRQQSSDFAIFCSDSKGPCGCFPYWSTKLYEFIQTFPHVINLQDEKISYTTPRLQISSIGPNSPRASSLDTQQPWETQLQGKSLPLSPSYCHRAEYSKKQVKQSLQQLENRCD